MKLVRRLTAALALSVALCAVSLYAQPAEPDNTGDEARYFEGAPERESGASEAPQNPAPASEGPQADSGATAGETPGPVAPSAAEREAAGATTDESRPVYGAPPLDANGRPRPLTIEETIRLVLDNNNLVRIRQLEILKSDTQLLKDEARYSPVLEGGYQSRDTTNQPFPGFLNQGNIIDTDRLYAKYKQLFVTGTYFELEAADSRIDTNRNEGNIFESIAGNGGDPLRPARPLHEGALTIVLQQELLRNAFGANQMRLNEIYRNQAAIDRQNLIYDLTRLVVQTMVDYWALSIAEENVRASEELLRNTRNVRAITIQKRGIGLAESFEVNQWNALASAAQIRLDQSQLERNNRRRQLLRTMNLAPDLPLTGAANLPGDPPGSYDVEADVERAYNSRPDFRSIRLQMANARKAYEISENQLLPSVTVGGSYSSRDYGRHANTSWRQVPDGRYPDMSLQFKVEYPLWNEDARVEARNARISLRQLSIQETELRRQIRDEIVEGQESIKAAYSALQNARIALEETRRFYEGLVFRYRQGRFTAVAVKEALDSLVNARQSTNEALINYNIALVRYDLTRNIIFEKYGVDIESVIDRVQGEQEAYDPDEASR